MYAKIVDGAVKYISTSGTLQDGRSVSNYHLLPESVLLSEGWLPLELNQPEYDPETQELRLTGYTVEADKVTANYEAVIKQPTIEERIEAMEGVVMDLIMMNMG